MYREGEAGAVVAKGSGVRASDTGRDNGSRNRRIAGLGFGGVLLVALLSGCDVGAAFGGFGWPQGGITPQSERMYDLWIGSVVAALVVGVFVWGLIFWCVIRYRKRGEELPPQTRFNMPMEVLYTVTPVLVVCVLFYYTAIVQTDVDRLSKDPDVTVEVVAFKWNWQFNYLAEPGEDAEVLASTIGSTDEIPLLVLPTGQKIRFEETSRDVIHSFWVPELLFKRDVLPGSARNVFEVTIDTEGRYVGRCAELCGTYHSMMNFELVSVSPERYQQFLAAKQAGQSTPEAMATIGFTGDDRFAITTFPFETKRDNNNFNGSQAEGEGR
ncbi:aa3-type cytochrome oxidase subunit II [Catenuloplanes indicus]|uniref:aa3-type cytochrome oxidase subunit II n=1 Tax=Catenuloplanes indicus TaxID=137267 RepID=UPI00352038B8